MASSNATPETACPTILITGSSSGIGRAAALHFASQGWHVFGSVRKAEDAQSLEAEAQTSGATPKPGAARGRVQAIIMDVTDEGSVQAGVRTVAAACGARGLNVLCNNAGIAVFGPLETTSMDLWKRVFETNVYGVAAVTRACLPLLRMAASVPAPPRGRAMGARVINIGSAAGVVSAPLQTVYTASKHALEGLTDCLRAELSSQHIQVILMQLGAVATKMATKIRAASLTATAPAAAPGAARTPNIQAAKAASSVPAGSAVDACDEDPVAAIYAADVQEALDFFQCLESTSIPMPVVLKALTVAATVARPATRYPVDGQIAMTLWLRWAMTDRTWDSFFPWAMEMAKKKAAKQAARA